MWPLTLVLFCLLSLCCSTIASHHSLGDLEARRRHAGTSYPSTSPAASSFDTSSNATSLTKPRTSNNISSSIPNTFKSASDNATGPITTAPTGSGLASELWPGIQGSSFCDPQENQTCEVALRYCAAGDRDCSRLGLTRTTDAGMAPKYPYEDQCILWDKGCSGNSTEAADMFFENTIAALQDNDCFMNLESIDVCEKKYDSPLWVSRFQNIKNWMRQPECSHSHTDWNRRVGPGWPGLVGTFVSGDGASCCDQCDLLSGKVDLFYWLQPGSNTSCLSVVGTTNGPFNDAHYTNENGGPVWTCSKTGPSSDGGGVYYTADVSSGGKRYLYNPWDLSPCSSSFSSQSGPGYNEDTALPLAHPTQPSSHSVLHQLSGTAAKGSPITTAVIDGHTL